MMIFMKAVATCSYSYVAVHVQCVHINIPDKVLHSNYWYTVDSLLSAPWDVDIPAAPWSPLM